LSVDYLDCVKAVGGRKDYAIAVVARDELETRRMVAARLAERTSEMAARIVEQ
jgi:hypothetical protein